MRRRAVKLETDLGMFCAMPIGWSVHLIAALDRVGRTDRPILPEFPPQETPQNWGTRATIDRASERRRAIESTTININDKQLCVQSSRDKPR